MYGVGQSRRRAGGCVPDTGGGSRWRAAAYIGLAPGADRRTQRCPRDDDFDAVLAEITGIAREARPDLIIHSRGPVRCLRPCAPDLPGACARCSDLSEVAPVVVRGGQPRLARAAGGPGLRRDAFADASPGAAPRLGSSPGRGIPATAGSWTTRPAAASSGSGWPRCRSSTRTGSWTSFTSPASGTRDYARHLRDIQAGLTAGCCDGCQPDRDVLVFAAHLYVERRRARPRPSGRVDISDTYRPKPTPCRRSATPRSATSTGRRPSPAAAWSPATPGSPLQLDFGEAGEDKSVVVVDADPGRPVRVDLVPLHAGRRLADFTAPWTSCAARPRRSATRSSGP